MRILPVVREFTGTWVNDNIDERLMLCENQPGKVQVLWKALQSGQHLILTGELAVKAAVASGYVYKNGDAAPKPSWWHKLLRITPKPKPWGLLTVHFINPQDLFVSYVLYRSNVAGSHVWSYRMNAEERTQIGEVA